MKSFQVIFIGLCCIFLGAQNIQAQQHTVKGYIHDAQTKEALQGMYIMTADSLSSTISDEHGAFELKAEQSEGKIIVSGVGYKEEQPFYDGQNNDLHVVLQPRDISLTEVLIKSFNSNKKNKETPGAIAAIGKNQIKRGDGTSLQNSFNRVPGVQLDQSTLSESRVSIRGNGVRAGWGVRNIKFYLNDIPVTEVDGTTRLEGIDVNDLGHAEISKGPASSVYGGGTTGGVVNFELEQAPYGERSMEASGVTGANGLNRIATTFRSGSEQMNSFVSYGYQEYKGYRAHSSDLRRFLAGNFQFYPSDEQTITLLVNRTSQDTQIPGAITKQQMEEDPKQASAENLDKQAGRKQTWTRVGLGQKYDFSKYFSNSTSIFTYFYDLDHPLAYAYLRNYYQSYGGRTDFTFDPDFDKFNTKFVVGAEYNQAKTKGAQYENDQGVEGEIRSNIDNKNTLYTVFYQSETELTDKALLTVGMSYNGLNYKIEDYLEPSESGTKRFQGRFSPRIALSYDFGEALSLHGGISKGFSPPTTSEIENPDGTINPEVGAEKATNYEINAKGSFFNTRFNYDLALFRMNMKGELIAQTVDQNVTIYNNSGRTIHDGVELALEYQAITEEESKVIKSLKPFAALTYSDFWFDDYKELDENDNVLDDYSGNKLTGIAPWILNLGVDLEFDFGFYFNGNFFYKDKLPLNDANTDHQSSYGLLNTKIGYKAKFLNYFDVDIYAGVNNINNTLYSSMSALNASSYGGNAPAYFNPSPKRNGYVGMSLKYKF